MDLIFCSPLLIQEQEDDVYEFGIIRQILFSTIIIQALSLAKECYSMKLDLLTNATMVDDAMGFVSYNQSKIISDSSRMKVIKLEYDVST
jgi:hypothetical protein